MLPPEPPRRTSSWHVALTIFGVGFLCCGGAIVGVAGRIVGAVQTVATDPPPLPGFAEPQRISEAAGGWSKYRFRDLGIEMHLPGDPKAGYMRLSAGYRLTTVGWALYYIQGSVGGGDLFGVDYRPGNSYTAKQILDYEASRRDKKRTRYRTIRLDRHTFPAVEYDYDSRGEPSRLVSVAIHAGNKLRLLRCSYFVADKAKGESELRRMLNSIRFMDL